MHFYSLQKELQTDRLFFNLFDLENQIKLYG